MPQEVKDYITNTKNFSEMEEDFDLEQEENLKAKPKKKKQDIYEDLINVPQSAKDSFHRKPYYMGF